jgi:hypothetical protein
MALSDTLYFGFAIPQKYIKADAAWFASARVPLLQYKFKYLEGDLFNGASM